MSRAVCVNSGFRFVQNITVGPHIFQADEPSEHGGSDAGPDARELLWLRWERARALPFRCMRRESSGLLTEYASVCRTSKFR